MPSIQFPAAIYAHYRPSYPSQLFIVIRQWAEQAGVALPAVIADIGCGTGNSALGVFRAGLASRLICVEPDQKMLEQARVHFDLSRVAVEYLCAPGERTGLGVGDVDILFCASAFHWMDRELAAAEFFRVLRRPGLIVFAEYRFPRSERRAEFDAWIEAKLESDWQIPELATRKPFAEMVDIFAKQPPAGTKVISTNIVPVPMIQQMTSHEMVGFIRSQSRYTRTRALLGSESAQEQFDRETEAKVHSLLGAQSEQFDFHLKAAGFFVS